MYGTEGRDPRAQIAPLSATISLFSSSATQSQPLRDKECRMPENIHFAPVATLEDKTDPHTPQRIPTLTPGSGPLHGSD